MADLIDIFDENGNPTGEVMDRKEARRLHKWRKSAFVWIVNSDGELLLQLRGPGKKRTCGLWDVSAGGGINAGETPIQGAIREIYEEIGVNIDKSQLTLIKTDKDPDSQLLISVFLTKSDLPVDQFSFANNEVAEVRYVPWRQLRECSDNADKTRRASPERMEPVFEYLEKNGF